MVPSYLGNMRHIPFSSQSLSCLLSVSLLCPRRVSGHSLTRSIAEIISAIPSCIEIIRQWSIWVLSFPTRQLQGLGAVVVQVAGKRVCKIYRGQCVHSNRHSCALADDNI